MFIRNNFQPFICSELKIIESLKRRIFEEYMKDKYYNEIFGM